MAKKTTSAKAAKPKTVKPRASPARRSPAPATGTGVTLDEAMRQLESLGNAGVRAQNAKGGPWGPGAGDNQFGVPRGDVRKLASRIKTNHELAVSLWKTGNVDAQFLATLLVDVNLLSGPE